MATEPKDDDRFRKPGSEFETEEPIAIAVVGTEEVIDWSDPYHVPGHTLWIPESIFTRLTERTMLGKLNIYVPTRLERDDCELLGKELQSCEKDALLPHVRLAASLLRDKTMEVVTSSSDKVLLAEGP